MQRWLFISFFLYLNLLGTMAAQTFDLQFVVTRNDGSTGGTFEVKVQIRANSSSFGLGTSNFVFSYNASGLSNASLTPLNFDNSLSQPYNSMTLTTPFAGKFSINVFFNGTPGSATAVSLYPTWTDIASISFTISDTTQTSNLKWRTVTPNPTNVFDDQVVPQQIPSNNLGNNDSSLPIELIAFTAGVESGQVVLRWVTESEINNLGFEVYKSRNADGAYHLISSYLENPDLAGQGNSFVTKEYYYIDALVSEGDTLWYKIADVDYNGVRTYHGPVSVSIGKGDVNSGEIPHHYNLHPNFPNPFNPATTIRFEVPDLPGNPVLATLKIYDNLGRLMRVLFNERVNSGLYSVKWDGTDEAGTSLPSGVYFAVFKSSFYSKTIRLIYLK